jgi:hypothetical protein
MASARQSSPLCGTIQFAHALYSVDHFGSVIALDSDGTGAQHRSCTNEMSGPNDPENDRLKHGYGALLM